MILTRRSLTERILRRALGTPHKSISKTKSTQISRTLWDY
jgi:hypothetical protein